jgi:hypothetical protein
MIPSSSWFPSSLLDRAAWYLNFNAQVQLTGTTLGLTAADKTQIQQDSDMMQFMATSSVTLENYTEAMTQFRNILTTGDIGHVAPAFPATPALLPPAIPPVGIFERVSSIYRPRMMASPAYTTEQGALYGIIGTTPEPPDPSSIQPVLQTFPAATGNMFSAVVDGRGKADQCEVWAAVAGTTDWKLIGTFTGKSGDITYPNTTGKPVQLQVRVQLRKDNKDYGQLSAIIQTTVNP